MTTQVPTDPNKVTDRDREAAAVVLPEFEQRLADAHARHASPKALARIQGEYDDARYDSLGEDDDDDDDAPDDGLSTRLTHADLDGLAEDNDVDLDGARSKDDKIARLRDAGVTNEE